jgi:hypothetical protein
VYRFRIAIDIAAGTARVWCALCDPDEVVVWDGSVVEALDAPPGYPKPGQAVRWRCHGPFGVLEDRPQEVAPERLLRSLLRIGPHRLDETYTLTPLESGCRLEAEVEVRVALPGAGLIERFYAGPSWRSSFADALQRLKRHCESLRSRDQGTKL